MTVKVGGFTNAASIIAWNAGRRSSVAVLPGSTNSRLAPTQDGHDRERCGR